MTAFYGTPFDKCVHISGDGESTDCELKNAKVIIILIYAIQGLFACSDELFVDFVQKVCFTRYYIERCAVDSSVDHQWDDYVLNGQHDECNASFPCTFYGGIFYGSSTPSTLSSELIINEKEGIDKTYGDKFNYKQYGINFKNQLGQIVSSIDLPMQPKRNVIQTEKYLGYTDSQSIDMDLSSSDFAWYRFWHDQILLDTSTQIDGVTFEKPLAVISCTDVISGIQYPVADSIVDSTLTDDEEGYHSFTIPVFIYGTRNFVGSVSVYFECEVELTDGTNKRIVNPLTEGSVYWHDYKLNDSNQTEWTKCVIYKKGRQKTRYGATEFNFTPNKVRPGYGVILHFRIPCTDEEKNNLVDAKIRFYNFGIYPKFKNSSIMNRYMSNGEFFTDAEYKDLRDMTAEYITVYDGYDMDGNNFDQEFKPILK